MTKSSKACRILYHCTAVEWVDEKWTEGETRKKVQTVVDDFWLKKIIDASAATLGRKLGKAIADVFLSRLQEVFAQEMEGHALQEILACMLPLHLMTQRPFKNTGIYEFGVGRPQCRRKSEAIKRRQTIRRKISRKYLLEIRVNPSGIHVLEVSDIGPSERRKLKIAVTARGDLAVKYGLQLSPRLDVALCRLVAYLWGQEKLELPRFAYLFEAHQTSDLEIACRYFWAIRSEPLAEDQKEKILLFWDRCVTWSTTIDPVPAKLLSGLSLLSCYLTSISQRELKWLLAVAPHISIDYNADSLVEELERLADSSPAEAGQVFNALLERYHPVFDFEDRLKKLVMKLTAKPETRPYALQAVERLRHLPGMVELYTALTSGS